MIYISYIGLSGLTTAPVQGSIVHGTPAQSPATPLDLSPLRHHRSPATTPVSYSPSNSPALDMIQEEHPVEIPRVSSLEIIKRIHSMILSICKKDRLVKYVWWGLEGKKVKGRYVNLYARTRTRARVCAYARA